MALYKCKVCGYVFDEEYHGRDIKSLGSCPLCAKPIENLVPAEEAVKEEEPFVGNAVYKCSICGYVYDEAKEGKPFSTLKECPVCKQPPEKFELISGEPEAPAEAPCEACGALDYDPQFVRRDPSARYMAEIHEMAVSGHSIHAAMSTQMKMPNWDDILILGAQLDPPPLNDGDEVDTTVVIGKNASV